MIKLTLKLSRVFEQNPTTHSSLPLPWRSVHSSLECTLQSHSVTTPTGGTLQPHSEYYRCTLGCHSMDLVKLLINRNTSSALQVECTLHCHSHNLVFVHIYTPIPLRVHKIATLQCHSMHFNIFTLRNIHSNATSRTCIIYALCWACKLINWYTCHFHF